MSASQARDMSTRMESVQEAESHGLLSQIGRPARRGWQLYKIVGGSVMLCAGAALVGRAISNGPFHFTEPRGIASLAKETTQKSEAATARVCFSLPGTKLKGSEPKDFGANLSTLSTPTLCKLWCQQHDSCKQSVFSRMKNGSSCQMFDAWHDHAETFSDLHNSSYCGSIDEYRMLLWKKDNVSWTKPDLGPPLNCSWAGENCMQSKCCANVCKADWRFSKCQWYTCFKQDEYFAGCHLDAPPSGWDGTKLGGHPNYNVGKAPDGIVTQGTKLFCFSVIMWTAGATMNSMDPEGVVANNWKKLGLHITQCDEYAFFDGMPTGSMHNIDSFTNAWKMVKDDGRWQFNDWTVKADADAVFFPDRLRWHIESYKLPVGSPVYVQNTDFKFHFLGAIEVLSNAAVQRYFERGWECDAKLTKEGGEDYWLLQCLEGIGVNYVGDWGMLHDKYAAEENCNDPWAVAFHFYKSVRDWNACHDAAYNAWAAQQSTTPAPTW